MRNSSGEKRILQGITVCLVSAVLSTMRWPGSFQTMSRGQILVFFNRHCSTMNLVKEKQGGLVPTSLKRWPFKLIKHFADATGVSPSHTGQCKRTGGCYNELVVAFFSTCGGVKGKKIYTCWLYYLFINLHLFYLWWHLAHRPAVTLQFMALPSNWWYNSWFGL